MTEAAEVPTLPSPVDGGRVSWEAILVARWLGLGVEEREVPPEGADRLGLRDIIYMEGSVERVSRTVSSYSSCLLPADVSGTGGTAGASTR